MTPSACRSRATLRGLAGWRCVAGRAGWRSLPGRAGWRSVSVGTALLLTAACGSSTNADGPRTLVPAADRGAAVELRGTTLDGQPLSLADLRGQVVVINVWGSWCGPCRGEAPALATVADATASQGVRFVGIDIRDNPDAAKAFERRYGISYPSLSDPGGTLLLQLRALPAVSTPTTIVLDAAGRPAARFLGPVQAPDLEKVVRQVVAEPSPATAAGGAS